jgi:hypothetical protein
MHLAPHRIPLHLMCDFNELKFQRLINLANGKTFYATACKPFSFSEALG